MLVFSVAITGCCGWQAEPIAALRSQVPAPDVPLFALLCWLQSPFCRVWRGIFLSDQVNACIPKEP